jgi:hypothetical protein
MLTHEEASLFCKLRRKPFMVYRQVDRFLACGPLQGNPNQPDHGWVLIHIENPYPAEAAPPPRGGIWIMPI